MSDFLRLVSSTTGLKFSKNLKANEFMRNGLELQQKRSVEVDSQQRPELIDSPDNLDVGNVDNVINIFKSNSQADGKPQKNSIEFEELKRIRQRNAEEVARFRNLHGIHVFGTDIPEPMYSFDTSIPLPSFLLHNIVSVYGFANPTPIQAQLIPSLLSGRDCIATAPTGSGKSIAFLAPLIGDLCEGGVDGFRGVVISPTNELATQLYRECIRLTAGSNLRVFLLSSENIKDMSSSGKRDILFSSPMRLLKSIEEGHLNLKNVKWLIMDECDKLLDLGFLEQVDGILSGIGEDQPTVRKALISATMPPSIEELANTVLNDPIKIIIGQKNGTCSDVTQKLIFAGKEEGKLLALRNIFHAGVRPPVLIFVQSKDRVRQLYHQLKDNDFNMPVGMIHADQPLHDRENMVKYFRIGKVWVLICTELLARGIDFKAVNCVINFDFPQTTASYIHRIGRTGRAGRKGEAYTLFTELDAEFLRSIVNVMKISGCEVPDWMLSLKPINRSKRKRLASFPPKREDIVKLKKAPRERKFGKKKKNKKSAALKDNAGKSEDSP